MVQFVVQSLLEAGVYLLAVFGFYGYVRPSSKGWITRRIRGFGTYLSERSKPTKFVIWIVIGGFSIGLFTMSRFASWNQIFYNPLKKESAMLASAIEADVKRGIHPANIFNRYDRQIETVIPSLLGSGESPELNELSKLYENLDISYGSLTNLAAHIRSAGQSIK